MAQWTTTYNGLIDLLGDYVEDNSTEFTSAILGIVNRAEERVLRDIDLAIWNETVPSVTAGGTANIIKGVSGAPIRQIHFTATNTFAERRTLAFIRAYGGAQGRPRYFYEDATRIYWAPVPDASYDYNLTYFARPTPLSGSVQTNWLTVNVADLLLWAALVEAEAFLIAPERVQEFEAKYVQMLGPIRAFWREQMGETYEPLNPTPVPQQTR